MSQFPAVWVTTRATGILALVLLTGSMVAGLVLKTRPFGRLIKGISATNMHRDLSIAALIATAVHGVMLVMDSTIEITWADLVVPGWLPYRPWWTALGVIAAELMLIVSVSFRLRKRIGVANWRRLHYLTYGVFILAITHGIMSGSDTGARWMQSVYVACLALVAGGTAFRAANPVAPSRPAASTTKRPARTPAHTQAPVTPRRPTMAPVVDSSQPTEVLAGRE